MSTFYIFKHATTAAAPFSVHDGTVGLVYMHTVWIFRTSTQCIGM